MFLNRHGVVALALVLCGFLGSAAEAKGKPRVDATNYLEPGQVQPIRLSSTPASAATYQAIPVTSMLPPVSQFSTGQQMETGLTDFILSYNKGLNWEQASLIAQAILDYSKQHQVDFRLVTGVVAVESSFRSDAISSSGAIGLGQLKPATAQWLGVANPFDPIDNIGGATRYISYLLNKYQGNLDNALSAYFQGPGFVDRNGVTDVCKAYLAKINTVLSRL